MNFAFLIILQLGLFVFEDHVVVYGGDSTSIAATVRMLQLRQPGVQVPLAAIHPGVHRLI